MANIVNEHFYTIGAKLGSNHPDCTEYTLLETPPLFNLLHASPQTVLNRPNELKISKACGIDGLTARLLKDSVAAVIISITDIFNLSIDTNTFPKQWKTAAVNPLLKLAIVPSLAIIAQ